MLATVPGYVQVGEQIVGIIAGILAVVGVGALAYFIVKRSKITGEDTLAQSAVNSLTGELDAYKSKFERQEQDIAHLVETNDQLRELYNQLEQKSEAQAARITELTTLITGSEKLDALDAKIERRFDAVYEALKIPVPTGGK